MQRLFLRTIFSSTFVFLLLMLFVIALLIGAAINVFPLMVLPTIGMLLAFYVLRDVSRVDFLREAGLE